MTTPTTGDYGTGRLDMTAINRGVANIKRAIDDLENEPRAKRNLPTFTLDKSDVYAVIGWAEVSLIELENIQARMNEIIAENIRLGELLLEKAGRQ